MQSYYNVHVTKKRGKYSRFPEHYWVKSSIMYAFYPTTLFQLGVYVWVEDVTQAWNRALRL